MAEAKDSRAKAAIGGGWEGKDLVMCEDGPRAGAWYFLNAAPGTTARPAPGSWLDLVRLAHFHGETYSTGRTLGYVPTKRTKANRFNGREAAVLVWAPRDAERRHPFEAAL